MAVISPRVNKGVKALNTDDDILNRIQNNLIQAIEPLTRVPIANGNMLQGISLVAGNNNINHGLDRKPIGYIVVSTTVQAYFADNIPTATTTSFNLVPSAATTVSLWVF